MTQETERVFLLTVCWSEVSEKLPPLRDLTFFLEKIVVENRVGHVIQSQHQLSSSGTGQLPVPREFDSYQHVRPTLNMVVAPETSAPRVKITPAFISKTLSQKHPTLTRQMIVSMIAMGLQKWQDHEPVFTMIDTATVMLRLTSGEYGVIIEIADLHFGGNVPLAIGWLAKIGEEMMQSMNQPVRIVEPEEVPEVIPVKVLADNWRVADPDYISVMEASQRLKVTPETIRKRCRANIYVSKTILTPHGPTWLIHRGSINNPVAKREQSGRSSLETAAVLTSDRCLDFLEVAIPSVKLGWKTEENQVFLKKMDAYYSTDRLKRMRIALGLTQPDASWAIGRTRDYILRMEDHGTRASSIGHRLMIAALYGEMAIERNVELEWLDGAPIRRLQDGNYAHEQ